MDQGFTGSIAQVKGFEIKKPKARHLGLEPPLSR